MNAEDIYNEIRDTILSIAKAERKKAEIKVKTLEIRYQYTPKEDACPIAKWKKNRGKIIKYNNRNMQLVFKDFKEPPFYPSFQNQTQMTSTDGTPTGFSK